ncbi:hypothetical protein DMUE_6236, partial [Dictyocoela muelleri]
MSESTNSNFSFFENLINKKISNSYCSHCLGRLKRVTGRQNVLRCVRKSCHKEVPLIPYRPFHSSKLQWSLIVDIIKGLSLSCSVSQVAELNNVSRQTVGLIQKDLGKLIKEKCSGNIMIGGVGVIVEIDESKFGKRKYNRGHRVDGVWILGMVERTVARRCVFVSIEKRNKETLCGVICRYVRKGSILYTDEWRGYYGIENHGYTHYTVNHSISFVNAVNGVHTNTIEGNWSALKLFVPKRYRCLYYIDFFLYLFMFKRNHGKNYF